MNVIQKFYDLLPDYWRQQIKDKNWFSLNQFGHNIMIRFEDGSYCYFKYAFLVEDKARHELAVFTEHSGYYIFSTKGLEWEVLNQVSRHR